MFLKNSFLKFLTFFLSLGIFCVLPFILILFIPFLLVPRYLVAKMAPWIRPDLGKLVTSLSSIMASDSKFKNPKYNVICNLTLDGTFDYGQMCNHIQKTLLESTFANGDVKYPELQQYITNYGGYYFWKSNKKFDIKNHVKFYEKSNSADCDFKFTDELMLELRREVLNKTWEKKRPLWEFIFVPNYYPSGLDKEGPFTEIICRFHHSLGDGYSMLNLLVNDMFERKEDFKNAVPVPLQRSTFETVKHILSTPFSISYTLAELAIMPLMNYPFKINSKQQKLTKCLIDITDRIPTRKIKEIKSHFNVSFTSVIFSTFAGAIREMLIQKNLPVPEEVPFFSPYPLPGHSEKLRNEVTAAIVNLPTGAADPVERLQLSFKKYQSLKNSHLPMVMNYTAKALGSVLTFFLPTLTKNRHITIGVTNFPAGNTLVYLNGKNVVDAYSTAQLPPGCAGAAACILSYNGGIRWCTMASSEIFTKQELRQMTVSLQNQIDVLYQYLT